MVEIGRLINIISTLGDLNIPYLLERTVIVNKSREPSTSSSVMNDRIIAYLSTS